MIERVGAGESAAGGAARATRTAERLARRAEAAARRAGVFAKGEAGERAVAGELAALTSSGFYILHDRSLPLLGGNVDHLVTGPTGVFVINAKNWSTAPKVAGGSLVVAGRRRDDVLQRAERERTAVAAISGTAGVPADTVRSVLAFVNSVAQAQIGPCHVVGLNDLLGFLRSQPPTLTAATADRAAAALLSTTRAVGASAATLTVAEFDAVARQSDQPGAAYLDGHYFRMYVSEQRTNGQHRFYLTAAGGQPLGWKDTASGDVRLAADCGTPRTAHAILKGVRIGGLDIGKLPEVASGRTFGQKLRSVIADVNRETLVAFRWRKGGRDRLYVHLLTPGKPGAQIGYVDLVAGAVHPGVVSLDRNSFPEHLLRYSWIGVHDRNDVS